MQLHASGVPAPIPSPKRRGPHGVQLEQVCEAADALLARGLKPTIERVRQHLGGGSPNTISPLLDDWYVGLSARVAGVAVPADDDLPTDLRSAWNHAKHEAHTLANQALQEEHSRLEQGMAKLVADEAALAAREKEWLGSKDAIEKALNETREVSEALRSELAAAQKELADLRARTTQQIDQLRDEVAKTSHAQGALRDEHARVLEARDAAWREERERVQAREAAHEKRFLAEVDRARQSTKALEAEMAKEKKRRVQLEDASAAERASLGAALQEARSVERELRKELQGKGEELSRAQALCQGLEERLGAATQQLTEEKAAHGAARVAPSRAIAAMGERVSKRSARSKSRPA
ncbi:DNA-binding protein [Variovorax sp. YR216]|uniref:DNA-binding protein n=1 Tax=Variovorax sp. YR216 TaxID=1882828 RepID=UPI00089C2713|nr:DNA-binding protein [Variovorax sp. YR216]SEB18477.1 replication region DNA-binding N-term [Variovorax sp. YR216]